MFVKYLKYVNSLKSSNLHI